MAIPTGPCKDIEIVFARGSGGRIQDNDEAKHFFDGLRPRIKEPVTAGYYELGQGWPGYSDQDSLYPAVAINGWGNYSVGLGAKTTSGDGFSYGLSVSKGVNELQLFLALNALRCPDTKYVIGGYSQGAQVVGQALSGISDKAKKNIVYVALFGDPKLYLPEGEGIINPPACQGKEFSNWRKDVPDCRTHEGALGARQLYIPPDFKNRVGLWCNDSDWVCGSSATPAFTSGHGKYASTGGAIDKAVQVIAMHLERALSFPKKYSIDTRYLLSSDGEARLNVAYIWNVNASSLEVHAAAQESIMAGAELVWSQGGRVSVTPAVTESYGESFYHPLGGMNGPFGKTVGLIAIGDRAHTEYRMTVYQYKPINYSRLTSLVSPAILTLNSLPWQKGAEKAMVYVAESAAYDQFGYYYLPSKGEYVTYADYLTQRALEIDPVNMYFVLGSDVGLEDAEYLAKTTGGKVVRYDPSEPATLNEALTSVQQEIINRPTVIFGSEMYETEDRDALVFDVSASYTKSGEIVRYDWDFEGDGVWDQTTTEPHAAYLYPDGFSGLIHVKATDSNGRIGTMTAIVESLPQEEVEATELPTVQDIRYEVLKTENKISTVRLTWQKLDAVPHVVLSVDGVNLGHITTDRTSIVITDVVRNADVSIDLQAMDENYVIGDRRGVIVPAISLNLHPSGHSITTDDFRLIRYANNTAPAQSADFIDIQAGGGEGSEYEVVPKTIPSESRNSRTPWVAVVIILGLAGLVIYYRHRGV